MEYTKIKVVVEPSYIPTPWWKDTKAGREAELIHNRLSRDYEYTGELTSPPEAAIAMVVGITAKWMGEMVAQPSNAGIRAVLASSEPVRPGRLISNVTLNRRYSTSDLARYLVYCGRKKIAFIGMDPYATADLHRYEGLMGTAKYFKLAFNDNDVFACTKGICGCIDSFAAKSGRYDAVICNNDLTAVYFMFRAREIGISVPGDIFLTGFGNTLLGRRSMPDLTTSTLNFNELGKQAAKTTSYLIKNPMILSSATTLASNIIVRGSTADIAIGANSGENSGVEGSIYYINIPEFRAPDFTLKYRNGSSSGDGTQNLYSDSVFSTDPEMTRIFALENFLMNSDAIDLNIIAVLSSGLAYPKIAEKLFISDSTLRYHIERIYHSLGIESRAEFETLIGRYLPDPSKPSRVYGKL